MTARTRRRLFWGAGIAVAAIAGIVVWLLVPNQKGGITAPTGTGPVQTVARPQQVPVTPERRAAIDRTLDRFVPLAMGRADPVAARAYVTPNLRSQATLAEWRAGTIPVPPFEAKPPYTGWTADYSYPKLVSVELTLEPKLPTDPVTSYSVDLKLMKGAWLVDGIYELGTHGGVAAPPKGTAAPAQPQKQQSNVDNGLKGRLGLIWLLVPLSLLSLIVIVPIVVLTRDWLAHKRVERRERNAGLRELPPLPRARTRD